MQPGPKRLFTVLTPVVSRSGWNPSCWLMATILPVNTRHECDARKRCEKVVHVLLFPSLTQSALANGADKSAVVTVGEVTLSRSDLIGAATSVAERIRGARRIAILAEPTAQTVVAVVGALIAGVVIVPVPPDTGTAERQHMLDDSGAQAWLGAAPDEPTLPVLPVRMFARSWHSHPNRIRIRLRSSSTPPVPPGCPKASR